MATKKPVKTAAPIEEPAVQATQAETAPATVAVPPKKSNKTLWIVLGVVLFLFLVVPALAITAGAIWFKNNVNTENTVEGILEKASGNQVDIDSKNGSFSVESENGDSSFSVGENQKLPDDFPKNEVPYLRERAVSSVITSTNEGKKMWWVTTTVDDSFESAKTYFADNIKEPTYTNVTSYGFGETQTYYGESAKYNVSVSVMQNTNNDPISVTYNVTEK